VNEGAYIPYAPLDTLKPFGEEIWIVDGPEIGMRYFGLTLPFPTRMTVVRIPDGKLWIHSPIAWNDSLGASIDRLGSVCYLVAPNTLHYSYLADWQARYPQAHSYGPPGLAGKRAKLTIDNILGKEPPTAWGDAFEQCVVPGTLITEVDFFHRASRTLILTDLIENFESSRVRNRLLRWTMRAFGAADPDGKAPIDMQLSFIRHRPSVREAARQMIAWAPERIVLAHGRCYGNDGVTELRRAFRWVL
jgi:hypothetical protein